MYKSIADEAIDLIFNNVSNLFKIKTFFCEID